MQISVYATSGEMAQAAAAEASRRLREAIASRGQATFVAATGASQFGFLEALVTSAGIDWAKTTMFHLDEYIGLPAQHPASFQRYLQRHFTDHVQPGIVHFIRSNAADPEAECERMNALIRGFEIDVAFVGIGENGHLAFNDPPADFEVEAPFITVELDEACRRQQAGEGWFATAADVPRRAISMSIKQIMRARSIICTVPDRRKAVAVRDCFSGPVSPEKPASILRQHELAFVYLDAAAASLMRDDIVSDG